MTVTAAAPWVADRRASGGTQHSWRVIAGQECRELWFGGRGLGLVFCYSVLLSCVAYLAATNKVLNFLEQREAVNLTLQVAMAVGVLVTLVTGADAISGERERGTLEALLLTPVSRQSIILGKLSAVLTLWLACWAVSLPYLWVLGRGVSVVSESVLLGLVVGTLMALALGSFGLLISALSASNKTSISISVFVLIALSAPTQLPTGLASTAIGGALIRLNPVGASLHYVSGILVQGRGWTRDLSYLAAPAVTALLAGGALLLTSSKIVALNAGGRQQ
jgi:ABC-2 type transport system permease protein